MGGKQPRKKWTKEDDDALLEVLKDYTVDPDTKGFPWSSVAEKLMDEMALQQTDKVWLHRLSKQCRDRYLNHLKGCISKDDWSEEELRAIVYAAGMLGHKWTQISRVVFEGIRAANSIKNVWNSRLKKNQEHYQWPSMPPEKGSYQFEIERRVKACLEGDKDKIGQQVKTRKLPVPSPATTSSSSSMSCEVEVLSTGAVAALLTPAASETAATAATTPPAPAPAPGLLASAGEEDSQTGDELLHPSFIFDCRENGHLLDDDILALAHQVFWDQDQETTIPGAAGWEAETAPFTPCWSPTSIP